MLRDSSTRRTWRKSSLFRLDNHEAVLLLFYYRNAQIKRCQLDNLGTVLTLPPNDARVFDACSDTILSQLVFLI